MWWLTNIIKLCSTGSEQQTCFVLHFAHHLVDYVVAALCNTQFPKKGVRYCTDIGQDSGSDSGSNPVRLQYRICEFGMSSKIMQLTKSIVLQVFCTCIHEILCKYLVYNSAYMGSAIVFFVIILACYFYGLLC